MDELFRDRLVNEYMNGERHVASCFLCGREMYVGDDYMELHDNVYCSTCADRAFLRKPEPKDLKQSYLYHSVFVTGEKPVCKCAGCGEDLYFDDQVFDAGDELFCRVCMPGELKTFDISDAMGGWE